MLAVDDDRGAGQQSLNGPGQAAEDRADPSGRSGDRLHCGHPSFGPDVNLSGPARLRRHAARTWIGSAASKQWPGRKR